MGYRRAIASAALLFTLTTGLVRPVSAQDHPVALVGATVMPISGPAIANGTVLIHGGKIKAVGAKVAIPADARRIDLRGKVILPGLIDANSSLFMSSEELSAQGAADRDVLDGADLFNEDAEKVLARGVTTVYISPGRQGSLTGVGAILKLRPSPATASEGKPGYARVVKLQAALKATLGLANNNRTSSLERLAGYEALRSAFKAAQQYAVSFERYDRAMKLYEAQKKQGTGAEEEEDAFGDPFGDPFGGFGGQAAPQKPTKPRRVPSQEIMVKALRREIPVRIEAHGAGDIQNALRLADEFKLKVVLESATEGYKVAKEIAQRKVPVVWGPALVNGGLQIDTDGHWPGSAASLAKAGVKLALATEGESGLASRFVLENAAAAAGYGLPQAEALRAVTLGAAEALGIADRVGSIVPGKDADLVILSAGPWSPQARIEQVWVDGERVRGK